MDDNNNEYPSPKANVNAMQIGNIAILIVK